MMIDRLVRLTGLCLIIFSVFISGCRNETRILDNGLTKKATRISEYLFVIRKDSLDKEIQDSLTITENRYNDYNLLIRSDIQYLFTDESMHIELLYNVNQKLEREIVTLTTDSLTFNVDHIYKDSLLFKIQSEIKDDNFYSTLIEEYEYNDSNTLIRSSRFQQYIDAKTNDTITNTFEIQEYDKEKLVHQSRLSDFINPEKNRKIIYDYDCGRLIIMSEFNFNDSLILKKEYKYTLDKYDNWIKREEFENGELKYIKTRIIDYK